jgi:transcriptional regulator with XRE-family HTH domain
MTTTTRLDELRIMLDMSMRSAAIGAAIRRAREEKNWKQRNLAAQIPGRAGVTINAQTVSNWERGKHTPDMETLEIVAQALGKPVSYFLSNGAEPEAEETTPSAARELLAAAAAQREAAEVLADAAEALLKVSQVLAKEVDRLRPPARRRAAS